MSTNVKKKQQEEEKSSRYTYNAAENTAYKDALSTLEKAKREKPTYNGTYESALKSVYGEIEKREPFKYSVYEDPLYKQYEDRYVTLGKRAMRDTVGQAASLTGGWGNTYAETAGQQQYGAYLEKLFDVTPELYDMALSRYTAEGDALRDRFSMLGTLSDREYGQYQDALSAYYQNVNALQDAADTAYDRGYQNWYDAQKMAADAEKFDYQKAQDAYQKELDAYNRQFKEEQWAYQKAQDAANQQAAAERLAYEKEVDAYNQKWNEQKWAYEKELDAMNRADREKEKTAAAEQEAYERQLERFDTLSALISKSGYIPTAEELSMAGMTEGMAAAYRSIYENSMAKSSGGGTSGGKKSAAKGEGEAEKAVDTGPFTGSTSAAARQYLTSRGISADGVVDEHTFNTKRAMYLQNPGRSDLGNPKAKSDMWAYYKSYDQYIKDYVNSLAGNK